MSTHIQKFEKISPLASAVMDDSRALPNSLARYCNGICLSGVISFCFCHKHMVNLCYVNVICCQSFCLSHFVSVLGKHSPGPDLMFYSVCI